jgi:hypothetical protein
VGSAKNKLLGILLFLVTIILLDVVIGRTLENFYFKEKSGVHYLTTYAMDSTEAEILVFGSSRANHHYVPEVFEDSLGLTYFNTGRDGNGIFYQLSVLRSVLKRYKPKIVILDYFDALHENRADYDRMSSLLPYYKSHPEIRDLLELRSPYERIKLLSHIYPYNSQLITILVGNLEMNKARKSSNNGYVRLDNIWGKEIDTFQLSPNSEIDSNKYNAFIEFLELTESNHIVLFVVYSPIYCYEKNREEFQLVANICSQYKQVTFLDYYLDEDFVSNRELFQDIVHLNHEGALLFSKKIVNIIQDKTDKK